MSDTETVSRSAVTAPAAGPAAAKPPRKLNPKIKIALGQIAVVVVWLGSWQWMSGRLIDPFFTSSPSAIGQQLLEWFRTGSIWPHLLITLQEFGAGLAIGSVAGVLVGFTLGRLPTTAAVLNPFVTVVYSMPKLALAPLFVLWFGIGFGSKIVLVGLISFFLVFYNTFTGARDVDPLFIDSLRIMGANRLTIYRRVVMPSAAVWVMTGLRIAVPQAVIGAVVGELISSNQGVGYVIANAAAFFNTTGVLAGVALVACVSVILSQLIIVLERWATRWKQG
ncbi:ABC transporter permease [Micromonospora sp. C28ISP2-4]|uniref:ABC transporter permease n=1 Tax=Micromonospora sp. C28ISP2-4 TaxID=3059523 RepID=UPI0026754EB1|nr:ABC transporter permease [Micromonospora sp. C28ISP2-4]MDO3684953.1 ABC transporter permease [Micromonospora sp. C28ISP2-4]